MANSLSVTWTACAITVATGLAGASAQGKRMWVDPPGDLTAQQRSAPAAASKPRSGVPADEAARPPSVATTGAVETAPAAAPARVVRKVVPVRQAAKTRAAPKQRQAKASSARNRTAKAGAAPSARTSTTASTRGRLSVAERPLEVMTLRTIELEDGRRYQVLVRPGL